MKNFSVRCWMLLATERQSSIENGCIIQRFTAPTSGQAVWESADFAISGNESGDASGLLNDCPHIHALQFYKSKPDCNK